MQLFWTVMVNRQHLLECSPHSIDFIELKSGILRIQSYMERNLISKEVLLQEMSFK